MQITRFQGLSSAVSTSKNSRSPVQVSPNETKDVYFGFQRPSGPRLAAAAALLATTAGVLALGSSATTDVQSQSDGKTITCTNIIEGPQNAEHVTQDCLAVFSDGTSTPFKVQAKELDNGSKGAHWYGVFDGGRLMGDPDVQASIKSMLEDFAQQGFLKSNEPVSFTVNWTRNGFAAERNWSTGVKDYRAHEGFVWRQDQLIALKKYQDLSGPAAVTGFVGPEKAVQRAITLQNDKSSGAGDHGGYEPHIHSDIAVNGNNMRFLAELGPNVSSSTILNDTNVENGIRQLFNDIIKQDHAHGYEPGQAGSRIFIGQPLKQDFQLDQSTFEPTSKGVWMAERHVRATDGNVYRILINPYVFPGNEWA